MAVEIEIGLPPYVYPSRAALRRLLRMDAAERRALVRQWRLRKHAALRKELPVEDMVITRWNRDPVGFRITLPAESFNRLRRLRHARLIKVHAIQGIRAKTSPTGPRLYAVKGCMACQMEGQTRGTQLCEERITIVSARSKREARRRVARAMAAEANPYVSTSGHFLRWAFEGITDVCECPDSEFNSNGTEVFYQYQNRRVRRQHEWHPASNRRMQPARAGRPHTKRSSQARG
jgi:hypothetical protein